MAIERGFALRGWAGNGQADAAAEATAHATAPAPALVARRALMIQAADMIHGAISAVQLEALCAAHARPTAVARRTRRRWKCVRKLAARVGKRKARKAWRHPEVVRPRLVPVKGEECGWPRVHTLVPESGSPISREGLRFPKRGLR